MPDKVADASILGAMMFRESRADEAELLVGDGPLYEPPLLLYELTNIARKKTLLEPGKLVSIVEALDVIFAMDIQWRDVDHPQVLQLALETGLTTYDASYIYVAQTVGVPLVTFDKKMQAAYDKIGGSN